MSEPETLNFSEDCDKLIFEITKKAEQVRYQAHNRIEWGRLVRKTQIKDQLGPLEPELKSIIKVGRALLDNGFDIGYLFCRPFMHSGYVNFGFVMHEQNMKEPWWRPEEGKYEIDGIGCTSWKRPSGIQHLFFIYGNSDEFWTETTPDCASETCPPHIDPDSVFLKSKVADFRYGLDIFKNKLSEYVNRIVTCKDTQNIEHLLRKV